MHTISISADVRRAIPFSTCPSTMSITPLISGTPGTRYSTLVARAVSAVQSKRRAAEAEVGRFEGELKQKLLELRN